MSRIIPTLILISLSQTCLANELILKELFAAGQPPQSKQYPDFPVRITANVSAATVYINDAPYHIPPECLPGRGLAAAGDGRSFGAEDAGRNYGADADNRNLGSVSDGREGGLGTNNRQFGSDSEGRQFGADDSGRQFGSDGDSRKFGADGEGREFGSDGDGRKFGADADGRQFGATGDDRGFGDGANKRDFGADSGGRSFGGDAGGRLFGDATHVFNCNLSQKEDIVTLSGLVGHEQIRLPEKSRFSAILDGIDKKQKQLRINDFYFE